MIDALRSLLGGLVLVLRAPALVAGVVVAMAAAAAPFGTVLSVHLQDALANQQPVALSSGEIDPAWWLEFREHAQGLEATFTPAILGFAAPLDNLSGLLDGTARPLALAGPALVSLLLWAFIWGVAIDRFHRSGSAGSRRWWSAGGRHFMTFAAISLIAAAASLVLYLTVHAVLFGPVYHWLEASASSERSAFFWRVGLYLAFGSLLATVSLVADYARVATVVSGAAGLREAFATAVAFLRRNATRAALLYVLTGLMFVMLFVGYGTLETVGGSRVGGWRAILVGQAYIIGRLMIRLLFAASEVGFYQRLVASSSSQSPSYGRLNPGPPAAK